MQSISKIKDFSFHLNSNFKSKPFASFSSSTAILPAISNPTSTKNPLDHPIPQRFFQSLKQRPPLPTLKQVHSRVVTFGVWSHSSFATSLINCYLFVNDINSARILFDFYPSFSRPTLIWNLLIRAYSKTNNSQESISLFKTMMGLDLDVRVFPDKYTFTFVVTSCANQKSLGCGKIVHGLVAKNGFDSDLFVGNSVVNMYSVFGRTEDARKFFDKMPERDIFSWTGLLSGYAKSGDIGEACEVFDRMPIRNEVSWAVMISGFSGCGRYVEAVRFFRDMLREGCVRPNEAILVSVLSACAHLGALDHGNWIHSYIKANRFASTSNIVAALIDMYAKCGRMDRARQVFRETCSRDISVYTSMISGLSIHGLGKEATRVFSRMLKENVMPNEITILGLLNGCSHSGLVNEGSSIFSKMESSWGIVPNILHYGSYIDLLGRAGLLDKAFEVVGSMPICPDIVIWRALLSACRTHRNTKLGERVAKHIEQLDLERAEGNALLSNLNASLGQWERVAELRNSMPKKWNGSSLGCSWIEVGGVYHEFRVNDQLHPRIGEIRAKLNQILERARLGGYVASMKQVLFDLSEEDKEQAVALHSEKLAIVFGIMSTKSRTLIRIVKNLRTCEDCHSALKAISLVCKRVLVVRDRSRFHIFRAGKCSCSDHW